MQLKVNILQRFFSPLPHNEKQPVDYRNEPDLMQVPMRSTFCRAPRIMNCYRRSGRVTRHEPSGRSGNGK